MLFDLFGAFDYIENYLDDIAYAIDRTFIDNVKHNSLTIRYLDIYMPCAVPGGGGSSG